MKTTVPDASADAPGARHARQWGLLCVLAGNMLIDALEVSTAIVVMPTIGERFALPVTILHGLMTAFALGFGGLMLFGLRIVALLGRRRVYLWALIVFLGASVVGGLTNSPEVLLATRFVKGFCAALTAPTGLAIIGSTFREGPARNRALSVYTLFGASGFTVGLLLAGVSTAVSWRLVFLLPAVAVAVLFLFGLRLIPADGTPRRPPGARRHFGVRAALAFCGALLAFAHGIGALVDDGRRTLLAPATLLLGIALLMVFLRLEAGGSPGVTLNRTLLNHRPLRHAALSAAAINGSYLGLLLVLTLQLQTIQGLSPLMTACALAPASAPLAVTALFSGRLIARFGTTRLIALGTPAPLLGYLLYLRTDTPTHYVADVLPTLLLVATGFVLAFGALNAQAMHGVSGELRGAAGGLYQSAVQTGAVLTLTAVAALLYAFRPDGPTAQAELLAAQRPALVAVAIMGALGVAAALTGSAGPRVTSTTK